MFKVITLGVVPNVPAVRVVPIVQVQVPPLSPLVREAEEDLGARRLTALTYSCRTMVTYMLLCVVIAVLEYVAADGADRL